MKSARIIAAALCITALFCMPSCEGSDSSSSDENSVITAPEYSIPDLPPPDISIPDIPSPDISIPDVF